MGWLDGDDLYLDPPFNTQQSFLQYDDALEHSVWLTMMRDRLAQVKTLLAPDGSVWVHCDDSEQAYLKVMMDEVFGRENFVACIVWEKTTTARNDAQHFSVDQDYILVFAKEKSMFRPNKLPRTESAEAAYKNPDGEDKKGTITGPAGRSRRLSTRRHRDLSNSGGAV